jgi:hypothetical protein
MISFLPTLNRPRALFGGNAAATPKHTQKKEFSTLPALVSEIFIAS